LTAAIAEPAAALITTPQAKFHTELKDRPVFLRDFGQYLFLFVLDPLRKIFLDQKRRRGESVPAGKLAAVDLVSN